MCINYTLTGATALSSATFGQGTGPILLDDVACNGTETRLWDCPNRGVGVHNCGHSEDASVRCQSMTLYCIKNGFVSSLNGLVSSGLGRDASIYLPLNSDKLVSPVCFHLISPLFRW